VEHNPKKPQLEDLIDEAEYQEEQEWQELIDSIEATDVPLDMLKYLRVHLADNTKMVFPILKWDSEGVDIEDIKVLIKKWYKKNNKNIVGSDFVVDLTKLKKTVKEQTNRTLKDL
jgi:hypothetical protein